MIKNVTAENYIALCEIAVDYHKGNHEPIPELDVKSFDNAKNILKIPFQIVFGRTLYPSFYNKSSILFYSLIKNHPLKNGNKRLACATLGAFYDINRKVLKMTVSDMVQFSEMVAKSKSNQFKSILVRINKYLQLIK